MASAIGDGVPEAAVGPRRRPQERHGRGETSLEGSS